MGKPRRHSKGVRYALCLAAMSSSCVFGVLAPLLPDEAHRRGVSEVSTGYIFSAFASTVFLVSPFMGSYAVPLLGKRRSLFLGILGLGLATVLFSFVNRLPDGNPNLFIFINIMVRILQGTCSALSEVASFVITAALYSGAEMTQTIGLIEIFVGIGYMIGPAVGGILVEIGGFPLPFLVIGLAQVPICLLLMYLLPAPGSNPNPNPDEEDYQDGPSHTHSFSENLRVIRRPVVASMLTIVIFANSSYSFLEPTLEAHVDGVIHSSAALGGLFLACSLAYAVAMPFFALLTTESDETNQYSATAPRKPSLEDVTAMPLTMLNRTASYAIYTANVKFWHLGPRKVVNIGIVFIAMGYACIAPAPWLAILGNSFTNVTFLSTITAMIFIGIGQSAAMLPVMDVMMQDCETDDADVLSGLLNSAYALGEMLGPIVGTRMTSNFGFQDAATTWAVVGALCFLLSMVCPKSRKRRTNLEPQWEDYGAIPSSSS